MDNWKASLRLSIMHGTLHWIIAGIMSLIIALVTITVYHVYATVQHQILQHAIEANCK